MTTMTDRVLEGEGRSHILPNWGLFCYALGTMYKKSHPTEAVECLKLSIVFSKVTIMENLRHSTARVGFFIENLHALCLGYNKKRPQLGSI